MSTTKSEAVKYVEVLGPGGEPLSQPEPGKTVTATTDPIKSEAVSAVPEPPPRPRVYDHLTPLLGRRFRNRASGKVRRLTFVGVAERDRVVRQGHKPRFGRASGDVKRVREVRVQLDEKLDIGAEAFVRGWDLVED